MRQIWYEQIPVAVFTACKQQAILHIWQHNFWKLGGGRGTAPILSMAALEEMSLPPAARYPLRRAGICIYGYTPHLTWLLEEAGGIDLAWWGWSEVGIVLLAAGWPYQQALDDPGISAIVQRLFGLSSPSSPLAPLTLPLFIPAMDREQRTS